MSHSIMINCISKIMPPARSVSAGMQLVCAKRGWHISKMYNIISKLVLKITHFINRFIQCGQNTVVSLMGNIQHCVFIKTGRIFDTPVDDLPCSQGIIHAVQNKRDNHHEYLTKIRKSEKNLQYYTMHTMIEADMRDNCNNFDNYQRHKIPLREEKQTIFLSKIRNYVIASFNLTDFFYNLQLTIRK